MSAVKIGDLVKAIRDDLASASGVKLSTGYDTLTEGINEFPLVQVIPEEGDLAYQSKTERTTFGATLRQEQTTINVDVYASQRHNLADDMKSVIDMADNVKARLELQKTTPPFGVAGVDTWRATWRRVTFVYGEPEMKYTGIRFILVFTSHN